MATDRVMLKDDRGRIIGTIDTQPNGDKMAKDFYGRIVGTYNKRTNITKDFYGRIVSHGDTVAGLLFKNHS